MWFGDSATKVRKEGLELEQGLGIAICVQSLIYGGSGSAFTRDPIIGTSDKLVGTMWPTSGSKMTLEAYSLLDPDSMSTLNSVRKLLEQEFKDALVIEFVIEDLTGMLYILHARRARRTPGATAKIAVDMVRHYFPTCTLICISSS